MGLDVGTVGSRVGFEEGEVGIGVGCTEGEEGADDGVKVGRLVSELERKALMRVYPSRRQGTTCSYPGYVGPFTFPAHPNEGFAQSIILV